MDDAQTALTWLREAITPTKKNIMMKKKMGELIGGMAI